MESLTLRTTTVLIFSTCIIIHFAHLLTHFSGYQPTELGGDLVLVEWLGIASQPQYRISTPTSDGVTPYSTLSMWPDTTPFLPATIKQSTLVWPVFAKHPLKGLEPHFMQDGTMTLVCVPLVGFPASNSH